MKKQVNHTTRPQKKAYKARQRRRNDWMAGFAAYSANRFSLGKH